MCQLFKPAAALFTQTRIFILLISVMAAILISNSTHAQTVGTTITPDAPGIVGGAVAEPGAWPWQVALVRATEENNRRAFRCGGTLIQPDWVLTAAHCVDDMTPDELHVLVGQQRLSDTTGERIAVDEIVVHPLYPSLTADADIALVHLASKAEQPTLSLYNGDTTVESELAFLRATIIGWGSGGGYYGGVSDQLRQVSVPLVARQECNAPSAHYGGVTENMLCTGYEKGGKGACYGDSGGPLMAWDEALQEWLQIGVVSWGRAGCLGEESYSVFSRVAVYSGWVEACLENTRSAACLMGDEYEADDSSESATEISVDGTPQTHTFHVDRDVDWFKFTAQEGVTYQIDTSTYMFLMDTILWLYDQDAATPLMYSDDKQEENMNASLVWRAPATGTYYFHVEEFTGKHGPLYRYDVVVLALPQTIHLPYVAAQ